MPAKYPAPPFPTDTVSDWQNSGLPASPNGGPRSPQDSTDEDEEKIKDPDDFRAWPGDPGNKP